MTCSRLIPLPQSDQSNQARTIKADSLPQWLGFKSCPGPFAEGLTLSLPFPLCHYVNKA